RLALAEGEIEFAVQRVKLLVDGRSIGLRLDDGMAGTERRLRFLHGAERAGGEEREDGRPQAGGIALRHKNRLAEHIGVDLIEYGILARDAAAVDDAMDGHAVLFHALENHARVERSAFDGGEEFVLRGVGETPAEGDAAQFGVHQDGAVAIVPGEAQETGLAGAISIESARKLGYGGSGAAGD